MTITVPPGAPGAHLRVMTPSGQPIDIVVPPGAGPGTQLQVPVPVRQPVRQPATQPAAASANGSNLAVGGAARPEQVREQHEERVHRRREEEAPVLQPPGLPARHPPLPCVLSGTRSPHSRTLLLVGIVRCVADRDV